MDFSLNNHNLRYTLTWGQTPLLLWPLPYAKRHFELSKKMTGLEKYTQRTLACFEAIPLLGSLVALIERVASLARDYLYKASKNPASLIEPTDKKSEISSTEPEDLEKRIKHTDFTNVTIRKAKKSDS